MTSAPSQVERLRSYLNELAPEARVLLVSELEREALRGSTGLDVVLRELRFGLRGVGGTVPRVGNPARLFFQPVEPFLINEVLPAKPRGRVARSALAPIWAWLTRVLAPTEAVAYETDAAARLLAGDLDGADKLARAFQDVVVARAQDELAKAGRNEEAERRLSGHLGSSRHLQELRDVVDILRARDVLATVAARLPASVKNLGEEALENARAVIETPAIRHPDVFDYALVVLMGRLGQPWQVVRLAIKAADTDVAAKLAESSYARAVEVVLVELDRLVVVLKTVLKSHRRDRIGPSVKDVHDLLRGLRTEIDLSVECAWSRRIAGVRKEVSAVLAPELEPLTGLTRRLLKPRRGPTPSDIDPAEVERAEQGLDLFLCCRTFAGEIALNEITQRVSSELQTTLDSATSVLIEGLRSAEAREKALRLAQVEIAVRLSSKLFGPAYAQLLTRAAEMAAQVDRNAAAS